MICSITLDFLNFDLLLYALGFGSDKVVAAYASARSVKAQESSLTMAPHPYRVRANLLSYRAFLFFVSFWLFLYVCDNFVTFYLLVTASIGLSFEAHLAGK